MHRNIHLHFKLEFSLYGSVWGWFDSIVANSSYMLAPELCGIIQAMLDCLLCSFVIVLNQLTVILS